MLWAAPRGQCYGTALMKVYVPMDIFVMMMWLMHLARRPCQEPVHIHSWGLLHCCKQ
jgi:hypothetical protein